MSDTQTIQTPNGTRPKAKPTLDDLKAAVRTAEQAAARAKKDRDAANAKVAKSAEKFKTDRADADQKAAAYTVAKAAVERAEAALQAGQRDVS